MWKYTAGVHLAENKLDTIVIKLRTTWLHFNPWVNSTHDFYIHNVYTTFMWIWYIQMTIDLMMSVS